MSVSTLAFLFLQEKAFLNATNHWLSGPSESAHTNRPFFPSMIANGKSHTHTQQQQQHEPRRTQCRGLIWQHWKPIVDLDVTIMTELDWTTCRSLTRRPAFLPHRISPLQNKCRLVSVSSSTRARHTTWADAHCVSACQWR